MHPLNPLRQYMAGMAARENPFDSPVLTLERAKHHVRDFKQAIQAFNDEQPWSYVTDTETSSKNGSQDQVPQLAACGSGMHPLRRGEQPPGVPRSDRLQRGDSERQDQSQPSSRLEILLKRSRNSSTRTALTRACRKRSRAFSAVSSPTRAETVSVSGRLTSCATGRSTPSSSPRRSRTRWRSSRLGSPTARQRELVSAGLTGAQRA
jgi:hypothetical protein